MRPEAPEFEQMLSDDTCQVLQQVNGVLDNVNIEDVTHEQINSILHDIGSSLMNTASSVFDSRKGKQEKLSDNKPWFNTDCKIKRNKFHKATDFYSKLMTYIIKKQVHTYVLHSSRKPG